MCSCPEGYLLGHNGQVPPTSDFTPNTDELLGHNDQFVAQFADHGLPLRPRRHLAIVACMDSRMDIFQMLGLAHGDAHVIRNAGGVVTDDVIRSLVLSQRLLGTREVILVHHTSFYHLGKIVDEQIFYLGMWGIPFTLVALVGLMNAINMADGLDGLAGLVEHRAGEQRDHVRVADTGGQ